ncbi:hypothetical protein [Spiroplasma taiwanense]|uniref:ABC transporter permease n=1 Tax=Spiroplasma taiwanense CT-1 TaxID=1276220 RepID=S5MBP2_9MOLU|nr:hypothetical protein [Spiroplasma taiwanense]AGR41178.1 ABC transporter permease [Spiroplasma taiwanense CT-1]
MSSFVFAILSIFFVTQAALIVAFNFYILLYVSCLLFILILRIVQFFYHNKIEDKIIFITLSNQVSRIKLFISIWILILIIFVSNFTITFTVINLINLFANSLNVNYLLLKITTTFLIYGIFCSIFLVNFIIFLIFIFSLQTTTVICTLLLSLTFIANLPMSFQQTNEKNMTINLQKNNGEIQVKLWKLYDSFYLQKYVNEGHIKYNYLSKWINDNFVANNYLVNDFFTDDISVHAKRIDNVWKPLGIINSSPRIINENNLEIRTVPSNDSNITSDWIKGDLTNIELSLVELLFP